MKQNLTIFLLLISSSVFAEDWYFLKAKDNSCHSSSNVEGTNFDPEMIVKHIEGCKLSSYEKEIGMLTVDFTKNEKLKTNLIFTKTIEQCFTFSIAILLFILWSLAYFCYPKIPVSSELGYFSGN